MDPETVGNNLQLSAAPGPEDYMAATNSYLEIIMTATDSFGLTSTMSRYVYPRIIEMCIDSEPQGLEIYVDEYPIKTPMRITSWVNHDLRLRTETQYQQGQQAVLFSAWSDSVVAEDREIRLRPDTTTGVVATFCADGNSTCIETARAADTVVVARCPTQAPTASPTDPPTDEDEESFPVDIDTADPNSSSMFDEDSEIIDADIQAGDQMHDNGSPPEDGDIWQMFDDQVVPNEEDGSSAVCFNRSLMATGALLLVIVGLCF